MNAKAQIPQVTEAVTTVEFCSGFFCFCLSFLKGAAAKWPFFKELNTYIELPFGSKHFNTYMEFCDQFWLTDIKKKHFSLFSSGGYFWELVASS